MRAPPDTRGAALRAAVLILLTLTAAGCARDMDDLRAYVEEVKGRPGGRIEPLPQVKPYETFAYDAERIRSPFERDTPVITTPNTSIRPDRDRNREFLEQYPLDTLRMVGSLEIGGTHYGLVQTADGLIHRVVPGNHLGQNDGRIVGISDSEISLLEIVADGLGGYIERPAAVALSE